MRSSIAAMVVVSAIAAFACSDKPAPPDLEVRPAAPPAQMPGDAPHTAGDAASRPMPTENALAGSEPETSPNTAAVGGSAAAARPSGPGLATIAAMQGKPMIVRATRPLDAAVGTGLQAGDTIETGAADKARLSFDDGSVLAIGPRSKVTLKSYLLRGETRSGAIRVAIGSFWMNITKWAHPEQSAIEVETPNAVAGVRGTTLWGDTQRSIICSLDGTVVVTSVSGTMKPASLTPGHCVGELDAVKLTPITPDAGTVQMYLDEVQIKQPR